MRANTLLHSPRTAIRRIYLLLGLASLGVIVVDFAVPLGFRSRERLEERDPARRTGGSGVTIVLVAVLAGIVGAGAYLIQTTRRTLQDLSDAVRQRDEQARVLRTNEERLKKFSGFDVTLASDPEAVYSRLVSLIGEVFGVKVVCLSEIAKTELNFRAVYDRGEVRINAGRCPLDGTPCATVRETKDIRVFDHVAERFPMAAFLREHGAVAYCGFPALNQAGEVVAVTCLLDDKPHDFSVEDQHLLRIIGQRIAMEVGRHAAERARKQAELVVWQSERRLRLAQNIARIGNWELDLRSNHLWWSDEIFRIFEIDRNRFVPSYDGFLNVIHPEDREKVNTAYRESLQTRAPYAISHRLVMPDGRIKFVEERCETDFAADGMPLNSHGTVQDVTARFQIENELRDSLREKETLLREIHHRVKNNLQVIASLLHFQRRKVRDAADLTVFDDVRGRLRAMTLVHEKLYQSRDLSRIDFGDYLRSLVNEINRAQGVQPNVAVQVEAEPVALPIEVALPCGLLVGELVTNALKYAFPAGRAGRVSVGMRRDGGRVVLTVDDNGIGVPVEFDPGATATFGWQLVRNLAAQIGGEYRLTQESGTQVAISFPLEKNGAATAGDRHSPPET